MPDATTATLGTAGDVLVLCGTATITVAMLGLLRMPDVYLRLHVSGKAVVFGVFVVAAASIATGDASMISRCVLIALFLLLTTPVATHAIAQAALHEGEPLGGPDPVDESSRDAASHPPRRTASDDVQGQAP